MVQISIDKYNDDQISLDELKDEVEKNDNYLRDNLAIVKDHELVALEIIMLGDYDKEKGYKGDIPYYIPKKEELLKYTDYTYFERTSTYDNLVDFFYELDNDILKAEELANEVRIS
jgi:thioredoxin-related protein